ncbi:ABC transporter ATP-binding protein [Azospira sp. APE16]|uniref:ABC transporter ATP-binding protein n=1 Tax=Azospira sp. APE16 TaxID=3394231 RepID=UPI003A4DCD31
MDIIRKILDLLSPRERRNAALLLLMILVMALLDVVGVASIMPFIAVLANPEVIQSNPKIALVYQWLGFSSPDYFLFFLGVAVFLLLLFSIAFKALTTWAMLRFTHMREYSLGMRLVSGYLRQPYEWFLGRHSADLGKAVLSEVQEVVNGALIPMMQMLAQGAVVLALLLLLIVADPVLALGIGGVLGLGYGALYALLRRRIMRMGVEREVANNDRFKTLAEAFGGVKEVKVGGLEDILIRRYNGPAKRVARSITAAQLAKQMPRFVLEALAFGGMLLVVLYLMRTHGRLDQAMPIIALYALGSYKLLPALQQVYVHLSTLRFAQPALEKLHVDLTCMSSQETPPLLATEAMTVTREIRLKAVSYRYPGNERLALDGLDLIIPAHATVGLVGPTGSGKTTTVDILLGLLAPVVGTLEVDGKPIQGGNCPHWQQVLGYVPQQIFLIDDSIAANIAFGVAPEAVDHAAVEQAARVANLHDFIIHELPAGYATQVGERGVRLSGGQRQRIGIARALYHGPRVLVLDEATSALDNLTEQAVMEAVHNLGHEITIIMIAHRLSTVRECDCIYVLDRGKVSARGSYDELLASSAHFRRLAEAGAGG